MTVSHAHRDDDSDETDLRIEDDEITADSAQTPGYRSLGISAADGRQEATENGAGTKKAAEEEICRAWDPGFRGKRTIASSKWVGVPLPPLTPVCPPPPDATGVKQRKDRYKATVVVDGVEKHVGYFQTPRAAAKAHDRYVNASELPRHARTSLPSTLFCHHVIGVHACSNLCALQGCPEDGM